MESYIFPDSDTLVTPDVVSVRSSMPQPKQHPDSQLLETALFLEQKSNNIAYSPCAKNSAPVVGEILKNHPLFSVLTKETNVPLLYVQQFWKSMEFHKEDGNNHFTAKVDHFTLSFGLNKFRQVLEFPCATSREGMDHFEDFAALENVLASVRGIGYVGGLTKASEFNKCRLTTTYNTLFTALSRSLTGKHRGTDTATKSMLTFFHGVLFNCHYDFASLIFHDIVEMLKKRHAFHHLPYPRFFGILIASAMNNNPDIPKRTQSQMVKLFPMQSIRYPVTVFPEREVPLFAELLNYSDQAAASVREYRTKYALMVQPEPAVIEEVIEEVQNIEEQEDQQLLDYGFSPLNEEPTDDLVLDSFKDTKDLQITDDIPLHSDAGMDVSGHAKEIAQRLHQAFETEPSTSQFSAPEATYVIQSNTEVRVSDANEGAANDDPTVEMSGFDDDDDQNDDNQGDSVPILSVVPCESLQSQEDVIRLAEIDLVENPDVRLSVVEGKENDEGERRARKTVQPPIQPESSRVPTSTGGQHVFPSTEEDMVRPTIHSTIPPSHSTISQQIAVSTPQGDSTQLVPRTHLESGDTDIVRHRSQPTTSFVSTSSLRPFVHSVNTQSLTRIQLETTFAGSFSSPAETSRVNISLIGGLPGQDGNPINADTMPTLNMGIVSFQTLGETGNLSGPGVGSPGHFMSSLLMGSTILGSSSSTVSSTSAFSMSATDFSSTSQSASTGSSPQGQGDLSKYFVTVTADNLIVRSMYKNNNLAIAEKIRDQTREIAELKAQVAALSKGKSPMVSPPPPPRQSQPAAATEDLSIPELKSMLMAKLLRDGSEDEADLVKALKRQADLQYSALQEQRRQNNLVTKSDFAMLQTSIESSMGSMMNTFMDAMIALSERVSRVEETCQVAANLPKRRHDDHDHDRHEERRKRQKITELPK